MEDKDDINEELLTEQKQEYVMLTHDMRYTGIPGALTRHGVTIQRGEAMALDLYEADT